MRKQLFQVTASVLLAAGLTACANNAESESKGDSTSTTTSSNSTMSSDTMSSSSPTSGEQGVMVGGAMMVPSKNIVENASASSDHTTLVAAVKAADLAGTLSGTGPFTVIAPTNDAFNKVPKADLDNLLKPENKQKLAGILTYHVVPGMLKAADLQDGQKLKTVQGEELTVSKKDGKVMINGANVTTADVVSSNGVTHVVDGVLMPKL